MVIGGLQKNSLIDYPGKLSAVIFFSGCNFDCPYCHNPDLARGGLPCAVGMNARGIYGFLEQRRGFLDGVVISGGEPTLQSDLAELCAKIKQMGFALKLDTNGSRPRVLKHLIGEGLLDFIAMDLKTDPLLYPSFIQKSCDPEPILKSIRLIMDAGVDYEFRTTCVKPMVTPLTVGNISRLIQGARLYVLQRFRNQGLLHPEFFRDCDGEYSDNELVGLKAIAERRVEKCFIR